jgi:hypothetical protein
MRIIQNILAYLLPIALTISTYYSKVEDEYKLPAIAYLIVGFILLLMYAKMRKGLSDWETNKRIKWTLLTLVKLIPLVAIIFLMIVIQTNTEVFISVMEKIILSFLGSLVLDFYTAPLQTELRIRDKIRLNSETGRVLD